MNTRARTAGLIKEFFSSTNYAVVGASTDSSKYGNKLGISRIWLQPGAENIECLEYANKVGLQIISGGPCVLVNGIKL
ncbi:19420_t:CDS:2 [Cetraspora pellucida]|uniref:19420_t:CDS:1 n=1 Tax=Cetraspora pellucida TaxID=1433469 RepID=A0A9N9J9K1_9GLOM|nr:19420_t:CDS:2 [Cetraspora pellucida]